MVDRVPEQSVNRLIHDVEAAQSPFELIIQDGVKSVLLAFEEAGRRVTPKGKHVAGHCGATNHTAKNYETHLRRGHNWTDCLRERAKTS